MRKKRAELAFARWQQQQPPTLSDMDIDLFIMMRHHPYGVGTRFGRDTVAERFQTGAPITINLPNDNANIGAGPAQRPNLLRNPNL